MNNKGSGVDWMVYNGLVLNERYWYQDMNTSDQKPLYSYLAESGTVR